MDGELEKSRLMGDLIATTERFPIAPTQGREITVPVIGGGELDLFIPRGMEDRTRRKLKRLSREFRHKSQLAANQATLAYTLGGSIGGTLATGGIIAIATGNAPIGFAGIAITAIGAAVTTLGITIAHRISNMRAQYDKNVELLRDATDELL